MAKEIARVRTNIGLKDGLSALPLSNEMGKERKDKVVQ